jgi:hypothetical protein
MLKTKKIEKAKMFEKVKKIVIVIMTVMSKWNNFEIVIVILSDCERRKN